MFDRTIALSPKWAERYWRWCAFKRDVRRYIADVPGEVRHFYRKGGLGYRYWYWRYKATQMLKPRAKMGEQ